MSAISCSRRIVCVREEMGFGDVSRPLFWWNWRLLPVKWLVGRLLNILKWQGVCRVIFRPYISRIDFSIIFANWYRMKKNIINLRVGSHFWLFLNQYCVASREYKIYLYPSPNLIWPLDFVLCKLRFIPLLSPSILPDFSVVLSIPFLQTLIPNFCASKVGLLRGHSMRPVPASKRNTNSMRHYLFYILVGMWAPHSSCNKRWYSNNPGLCLSLDQNEWHQLFSSVINSEVQHAISGYIVPHLTWWDDLERRIIAVFGSYLSYRNNWSSIGSLQQFRTIMIGVKEFWVPSQSTQRISRLLFT